jgi:hypothetical protein
MKFLAVLSRPEYNQLSTLAETSKQTGQFSYLTPTRSPSNRHVWKKPLALVPSLFELPSENIILKVNSLDQ